MPKILYGMLLLGCLAVEMAAQEKSALSPLTKSFITVDSPVVALEHVRVIDGSGAAAVADQTMLIENGIIREIGPTPTASLPSGARVLDHTGRWVLPGFGGRT